jgi:hypothetical protein
VGPVRPAVISASLILSVLGVRNPTSLPVQAIYKLYAQKSGSYRMAKAGPQLWGNLAMSYGERL